jgi:arsenate reductase-like glutaredoxin family protein
MIENEPNEITVLFNSNKEDDKKARGYAEALPGYVIKAIDLARESLTETQIAQVAEKMGVRIEDLVDPSYDDHIGVHTEGVKLAAPSDLLTIMAQDPMLLHTPILIVGKRAFKYGSGYNIIKEDFVVGVGNIEHGNIEERDVI